MVTPSQQKAAVQLETLARAEFADLDAYPKEVSLLLAVTTGNWAGPYPYTNPSTSDRPEFSESGNTKMGLDPWGSDREVRADLIRWLCVNRDAKALVDPQGLQLSGARLTGELNLDYVDIPLPVCLCFCRLTDAVSLIGCQVPGLSLMGSWTRDITAEAANIRTSLELNFGFRADGMVSIMGAHIGRDLACEAGTFLNRHAVALYADRIVVGGSVHLRADRVHRHRPTPCHVEGAVRLHGASIGGDLSFAGGHFANPCGANLGRAIHLGPAVVKGTIFFRAGYGPKAGTNPKFEASGIIDLRGAVCSNLADERDGWPEPGHLWLDGFVYDRFRHEPPQDCPVDAENRLKWLKLDATGTSTQAYRQLARVLQDSGDPSGATQVLEAMEAELARKHDLFPVRWLKWTIGFGYRPQNAVWGLLVVWVLGALLYSYGDQRRMFVPSDKDAALYFHSRLTTPDYYPSFSPLIFSLENTFPLVKLGQAEKWMPDQSGVGLAHILRWGVWIQNSGRLVARDAVPGSHFWCGSTRLE
jgi:hypothetical protein